MGKVVKLLLLLAFILLVFWVSDSGQIQEIKTPSLKLPSVVQQEDEVVPYSIEALREREYRSEIKTREKVSETTSFTTYVVSYDSDGLNLFALMNVPKGQAPDNGFPVAIVNHGYINPEAYSTLNHYRNISDYYAQNGYLVLKPDYRGHGNSESAGGRVLNRINYTVDVLNLIAALNSIPEANPEKIVMYGHSMGGEITLRVLEVTDRVSAATLWAPVSVEFPESFLYFVRRHRSQEELTAIQQELRMLFEAGDFDAISVTRHLSLIKTPFIIHHGTQDESVPFEWSENLVQLLDKESIEYTFYRYPGEDHNFRNGSWPTAARRDLELFRENLQN